MTTQETDVGQTDFDHSNLEGSDDRIESTEPSLRTRGAALAASPAHGAQGTQSPPEQGHQAAKPVPLGEILELRRQAASTIGQGSQPRGDDPPPPPAAPTIPDQPPTRPGPDRVRGSGEEREQLAAFLADFARELGDQAPLPATVTRALRVFKAADVPPERWGDHLYRARAIAEEPTGQITKKGNETSGLRRKNKMPYYFGVLEQLVGLRPPPEEPGDRPGRASPA